MLLEIAKFLKLILKRIFEIEKKERLTSQVGNNMVFKKPKALSKVDLPSNQSSVGSLIITTMVSC
jgi:hypothetical protein